LVPMRSSASLEKFIGCSLSIVFVDPLSAAELKGGID
jgi:hypothetical protein